MCNEGRQQIDAQNANIVEKTKETIQQLDQHYDKKISDFTRLQQQLSEALSSAEAKQAELKIVLEDVHHHPDVVQPPVTVAG